MLKRLKSYITINNAILAVALMITASWAWGTVDAIQKNFALQQQVDALAAENGYYELQNQNLKFQQNYYQTNEYLELSARARLNKALPGEKLLVLPPNTVSSAQSSQDSSGTASTSRQSNFAQWMYFLFGNKGS